MYNFELLKDEKIEEIFDDVLTKNSDNIENVSVIITNVRLIILSIPKDIESFRFGKIINYPKAKEVIFEVNFDKIKEIKKDKDFNKYILSDNSYFLLNNNDVYKLMKRKTKN